MQCANLMKRRSLDPLPWSCRAKRACLEAELQTVECPMETSHNFIVTNLKEHQVCVVRPRQTPLCCPRCLGGEPGHINHIMGQ